MNNNYLEAVELLKNANPALLSKWNTAALVEANAYDDYLVNCHCYGETAALENYRTARRHLSEVLKTVRAFIVHKNKA